MKATLTSQNALEGGGGGGGGCVVGKDWQCTSIPPRVSCSVSCNKSCWESVPLDL